MTKWCSCTWILLFLTAGILYSDSSFRWSGHLDVSLVQDNNVLEQLDSTETDITGRFLLNLSANYRYKGRHIVDLIYNGGIEGYSTFNRENRSVQQGSFFYTCQLTRWMNIGINTDGRWRSFFTEARGYQWVKAGLYANIRLPWGFSIRGYSIRASMDNRGSSWFDFKNRADGLTMACKIWPVLLCSVGYHTELQQYKRPAYDYFYHTPDFAEWQERPDNQKNLIHEYSVGLEWLGWMLLRLQIRYQLQFSNSYGYDYERPGLEFMGAKSLPWSLTLRIYGRYQKKTYLDDLAPLDPMYPDSETEENQYLLCDLIRDLSKTRSLRFRTGWYRNESPLRDLYYEKTIISIGLSQSF